MSAFWKCYHAAYEIETFQFNPTTFSSIFFLFDVLNCIVIVCFCLLACVDLSQIWYISFQYVVNLTLHNGIAFCWCLFQLAEESIFFQCSPEQYELHFIILYSDRGEYRTYCLPWKNMGSDSPFKDENFTTNWRSFQHDNLRHSIIRPLMASSSMQKSLIAIQISVRIYNTGSRWKLEYELQMTCRRFQIRLQRPKC